MTIQDRTVIQLSDGRELIYFDETVGSGRADHPDTRQLPPPPPASQLRYDPLVDEWVAVAAHRQTDCAHTVDHPGPMGSRFG